MLYAPPLGVTFRVSEGDQMVYVLRVWNVRRRQRWPVASQLIRDNIHHLTTIWLNGWAGSEITHIINDLGGRVYANNPSDAIR